MRNYATMLHKMSITQVITVMVCMVVLLAIVMPITTRQWRYNRNPFVKDGAQLKQLHQAMLILGRENAGIIPRPGLLGLNEFEREDITKNTTANFYSYLIMCNAFAPQMLISPLERNPNVQVCETYKWEAYNAVNGTFWDPGFKADLAKQSHVSYAHPVFYGKRADEYRSQWQSTFNSNGIVLGNRGPKDGQPDANSYTCDSKGNWSGFVVRNDGHVERLTTMTPNWLTYESNGQQHPDNIFAFDDGIDGVDVILSFTQDITEDGPVVQHD